MPLFAWAGQNLFASLSEAAPATATHGGRLPLGPPATVCEAQFPPCRFVVRQNSRVAQNLFIVCSSESDANFARRLSEAHLSIPPPRQTRTALRAQRLFGGRAAPMPARGDTKIFVPYQPVVRPAAAGLGLGDQPIAFRGRRSPGAPFFGPSHTRRGVAAGVHRCLARGCGLPPPPPPSAHSGPSCSDAAWPANSCDGRRNWVRPAPRRLA